MSEFGILIVLSDSNRPVLNLGIRSPLSDCLDQYNPLDDLIEDAINTVLGNAYADANKFIEAAMSDINVCDSQLKASNVEEKAENKNGDEVQLSKNLKEYKSSLKKHVIGCLKHCQN
ncbi:Unknown protein [Striga hermonthica]|uniref:Uncharacterized protein n=1 Tax=Striga hermonthica TaxID=68872 RepID=A0A9N7ND52_STRHE|nr:Unknown protein [Striga hermonthica]